MSNAVDHIGVLVGDLDAAVRHYQELFRIPDGDVFGERGYHLEGTTQLLDVAFVKTASVYFEFFAPGSAGPIADLHARRGDGVHHVAMRCDDVRAEWARHEEHRDGFGLLDAAPNVDANGCSYWFLHPQRNFGVLIEPQAAWVRTSVADFTQLEATPDWARELAR
jgi:methylmalonyl-CoA/ethylmalonyl-CoA epimerase